MSDADAIGWKLDFMRADIEEPGSSPAARLIAGHAARLLAAVEAALKQHRRSIFPAGPPGAGDAFGKHYCAGVCHTSIDDQVIYRVWPCQPYQDIRAALTGEEAGDDR